jgi:8-oxo-dGTP pyrophosphatase MutT (NUDIX family)
MEMLAERGNLPLPHNAGGVNQALLDQWTYFHHNTLVDAQRATLVFPMRQDFSDVYLMHRTRGVGAGLWNGMGGRLEESESFFECALRESEEESGIRISPAHLDYRGSLLFIFNDQPGMYVQVFATYTWTGSPMPITDAHDRGNWFRSKLLPFADMWPDDPFWFPWMLMGIPFLGLFVFYDSQLTNFSMRRLPFEASQPLPRNPYSARRPRKEALDA